MQELEMYNFKVKKKKKTKKNIPKRKYLNIYLEKKLSEDKMCLK